jgi:resolvase-like protein/recombinase-like zinc beta ribbon protein
MTATAGAAWTVRDWTDCAMAPGAYEAALVLCPDRLARKYAYQVLILEELERFDVRVIFLEQPPSEDPHARLLVQIQGAIAEYERIKIAERYRRGKLFRARQGEVIFWKVPYYFNRHESLDGDPTTAGRRRRSKSRTRCRPSTEWIPISIPPILSEDLFRRSQAIHPDNSRFSPRHLKSGHYLLRGLVRCRVCDLGTSCHRMRGRDGTFHHYYSCMGHDVLRARRPIGRCSQRNLRADELDELVWAEVRRHLGTPALIMEAYTKLRAEPVARHDDLVAQEVREFQKRLAELNREEHRLLRCLPGRTDRAPAARTPARPAPPAARASAGQPADSPR